jgi:hypothetical protein
VRVRHGGCEAARFSGAAGNEPPLRVHSRFKKPAYNSLTN